MSVLLHTPTLLLDLPWRNQCPKSNTHFKKNKKKPLELDEQRWSHPGELYSPEQNRALHVDTCQKTGQGHARSGPKIQPLCLVLVFLFSTLSLARLPKSDLCILRVKHSWVGLWLGRRCPKETPEWYRLSQNS
ncbi:TBC1 domain family member 24-like [Platysternon megacephalum]|uniref:TBC1 domain family member 24-like n=1 Tax=Platysternon megacephalum TaxID=55544 RepID=A0A4D9E5A9_9SAUR|nr:TBC1 domain family member 24-like [Platysternon megacephalum]